MDSHVATYHRRHAWSDLVLVMLGALTLLGLVLFDQVFPAYSAWVVPFRIIFGLLYVLYVPGYLLQGLFFARMGDLDIIERAGLSLTLSVALVSLLALLLDSLPWGLRLWSIVIGQCGMTLLLLFLTVLSRLVLPAGDAYHLEVRLHPRRYWAGLELNERRLMLVMAGALLVAGLAAAWIFLAPNPDEFMTEFYILGKDGLAEDYPRHAVVGEPLQVTLGLNNLEHLAQLYRVEVWVQDAWNEDHRQLVANAGPLNLVPGHDIEQALTWSMPWAGEDQQVDFLLYLGADPEPYRRLRLFVNVDP